VPSTRQNIGTRQTLICRVSGPRQTRALGKYCQRHNGPNAINFAECQALGTRQIIKFAECHGLTLGNFFFDFGHQFFLVALQQYQEPHIQILHILTDFFYISLVYSILLIFFGKYEFEPQVHWILDLNDSKNDIHVCECKFRTNPGTDLKFLSTCSRGNATKLRASCFLIP